MREVVAGAGAHEGHVGCMWDGGSTLRGGWACQRDWGASRRMGHVLGGHGATHRVSPSVGWFAWTRGWQRRRVVGVRTHAHKHGGHGRRDVEAVEMVVTARQRWAGQQFFWRGVTHTCPPGHVSGPKKKSPALSEGEEGSVEF